MGLTYKEIASVPVGYERQIEMFSLDFEEFLWAAGKNKTSISALRTCFDRKEKIEPDINNEYLAIMNDYLVVGGMPEAVNVFIETNNYREVYATQQKILDIAIVYGDVYLKENSFLRAELLCKLALFL